VKGGDVGELAVSGDVAQQPPRRRAHIGYERATCGISVHADDVAGPFRTLPDLASRVDRRRSRDAKQRSVAAGGGAWTAHLPDL